MSEFIKIKLRYGIGKEIFKSKEYPSSEKIKYFLNAMRTEKAIYKNGINTDLFELVQELAVPVLLISGRYDLSTPLILVENFCQSLSAPKSRLLVVQHLQQSKQ